MFERTKQAWSKEANVLFSRTRQNSHTLWLSKVLSRSTATLGSLCFSRRYWGPGRSKGQEGRKSETVNLTWKNTAHWQKAVKALGKCWRLSWGSGYPRWEEFGYFSHKVSHTCLFYYQVGFRSVLPEVRGRWRLSQTDLESQHSYMVSQMWAVNLPFSEPVS